MLQVEVELVNSREARRARQLMKLGSKNRSAV
jgi:hypothetical protein